MYIPKSQGKEARRVRQKRRLDFGDRARQGWLYGPCAACVTPPRPPPPSASRSRAEANTIILGRNTTR